jgi:hypothetical protein
MLMPIRRRHRHETGGPFKSTRANSGHGVLNALSAKSVDILLSSVWHFPRRPKQLWIRTDGPASPPMSMSTVMNRSTASTLA